MNVKQLRNRWGVMLLLCVIVGISTALAGPTTFVSDDFNAYNLKRPLWTLVDPKNDCTLNLQGVNSGSARLFLTTPAGTTHDIWSDGNTAPRILQNCANEDFTVETKFLSSVTGVSFSRYQAEGILVQADDNNFIRFDFTTGNNDSTTAFAAAFIGGIANPQVKISKGIGPYGIAPLYLRVNRTGNVWTMMVSRDGNTFDTAGSFAQPLAVSKIGLYAINAGTTPQSLTMIADYFWNMDVSLASQDAATNVTDTQGPLVYAVRYKPAPDAIQVSWRTDEAANGTVDYGTTTGYGQTVTQSTFTTDHILTAFGLSANTLYHLRISGTDGSGHSDNSGDLTATSTDYYVDSTSVSDDFNAPSLDAGLWTTVNPRGDAAFAIDAKQLSIAVPGGIVHEIYTAGNTAPRVVQTVNPTSNVREWILKFNSIPAGTGGANTSYPMQGLYLEQDSINVMRFDIWSDGNNVMVFVASFTDGFANVESHVNTTIPYNTAPIWLKVVQGGASWHVYYSSNGTSWVQAWGGYHVMNVRKAGPYAGNSGSAPQAFTALVDYFQAALPSKPYLTAPTAGQANVIRPVAFSWDTATGASLYRMQVSTNSGFTSMVFDSTFASTSRYVSVLNPTSQYYWRVRGVNGTLNGPYSAGQSFTTAIGSPATPSLVSPADNVAGITITPTMIWTKSASATSYRLQIGTDSTFAGQLAVNDSTITDTVFTTPALAYNARYFWRVAAKNAGGYSAFTAVRRFTTRLATPPVPVLLSPAKGAVDQPVSLTLSWNASEGAVAYWIQVDTDTLFTAPYVMEDTAVTTTSSAVSGLAHSTSYYWRVRAKNAGGASAASETWNFTTVVAPPAQPVLLSPVDGATGQLSSLLLVWTRPAGATTFRLQVGTDSTFLTGVFFNDSTLTDTLGLVNSLAYGQKYYWKVSAKNAGGTGPSSAIFSFFTLASDPTRSGSDRAGKRFHDYRKIRDAAVDRTGWCQFLPLAGGDRSNICHGDGA